MNRVWYKCLFSDDKPVKTSPLSKEESGSKRRKRHRSSSVEILHDTNAMKKKRSEDFEIVDEGSQNSKIPDSPCDGKKFFYMPCHVSFKD